MDVFQTIAVISGFVYLFGFLGWVLIDGIVSYRKRRRSTDASGSDQRNVEK